MGCHSPYIANEPRIPRLGDGDEMATSPKPTDPQRCLLACVARIGSTEPAAVFADCGMRGAALARCLAACQRRGWINSRGKITAAGRGVIA